MENTKLYKWALWLTAIIAFLGFVFSYMTLLTVAQSFNMNFAQVIIFPLLLDLLMVVSHLVYFYFRTHNQDTQKVAALMYGSVAFSVAFNLSHASWNFGGDWIDGQNAMAFLDLAAWALPPVALLACVKMISGMVAVEMKLQSEAQPATDLQPEAESVQLQDTAMQPEPVQLAPQAVATDVQAEKLDTATRRNEVARAKRNNPDVPIAELASLFAVNPSTISRDITHLQDAGILNGTH